MRLLRSLPEGSPAAKSGEVSPGDDALVITANGLRCMRWGYQIGEKKDLIINARSETVSERRTFAGSVRCVVPALCYYEWFGERRNRTRYRMWREGEILFMAGIFRNFGDRFRFTVLTREACPSIRALHDRMPVLIGRKDIVRHLEGNDPKPLDHVESVRADGQMSLFDI